MSDYTIVDARGEILKTITVPNAEHLALNTPLDATAVDGSPPSWNCYYADFAWIDKGVPSSPSDSWDADTKAWRDTRSIEKLRSERWDSFRQHRDELELGTFIWDGSVFDGDQLSQSRIEGAVVLALVARLDGDTNYSQVWKLADNTTRALNADDMIQVGVARGAYVKRLHIAANAVYEQLQNAASIAAIKAVEWPASEPP